MSSKHQRETNDSDDSDAAKSNKVVKMDTTSPHPTTMAALSSLPGFWLLPQELRLATLELACYRALDTDNGQGGSVQSRLHFDMKMALNLAVLSHQFHPHFQALIYAHVSLDRPSTLASFHNSLVSRPSNAALVKSLHLGPLEELNGSWWPVEVESSDEADEDGNEHIVLLKTSLSSRDCEDKSKHLPHWCEPERAFAYGRGPKTCREEAVAAAISTALQVIGIDLIGQFTNAERRDIDINSWTIRLFEAQAVLDLYLCAIRQFECDDKSSDCCGCRYPRLILHGFERPEDEISSQTQEASQAAQGVAAAQVSQREAHETDANEQNTGCEDGRLQEEASDGIVITREQVMEHLARQGAGVDHFEHPLSYARADWQISGLDHRRYVEVNYIQSRVDRFYSDPDYSDNGSEIDSAEFWSDSADSQGEPDSEARSKSWSSSRASLSTSSTASSSSEKGLDQTLDHTRHDGVLNLGVSVLRRVAGIRNLSLTGSLYQLLDYTSLPLGNLRFLSVGPFLPHTEIKWCLENLKLAALEKLRICGENISDLTARQIAGVDAARIWPMLKKVEWDFGHRWYHSEASLLDLFHRVQGRGEDKPSAVPFTDQQDLEQADSPSPETRQQADEDEPPPHRRQIEARIPPPLVPVILQLAHPEALDTAWASGLPVSDAPHTLRVKASRATKTSVSRDGVQKLKANNEAQWQESRQWWEQRALECGCGLP